MNLDRRKKRRNYTKGTSAKSRTKTCISFGTMASFIARRNSRAYIRSFSRRGKEISDSIILYKTGVQNDKSSDKFSCARPWFLSINQTPYIRPTGLSLIFLPSRKRNRIAAIRRINLFFCFNEREERKKKLIYPSFLIFFDYFLTRKIFTFFLNGSGKFLGFVCTKM